MEVQKLSISFSIVFQYGKVNRDFKIAFRNSNQRRASEASKINKLEKNLSNRQKNTNK